MVQARKLAARVIDLIHADGELPVLHAAFRITTGVINQALTFDICVIPFATLGVLAEELDNIVLDLISRIVGHGWNEHTLSLIRLSRCNGGCGIPSTADRAHTAFLSTILRCPPGATDTPEAWQQAGVLQACDSSIKWIRSKGVWLDSWAMPRRQQPKQGDTLQANHLPAVPLPGRQPTWRAVMAEIEAESLTNVIPMLESRAGEEGGALLAANGGDMQVDLTDTEFRTYLRMRLGLEVCVQQRCQHRAVGDQGKQCTQTSDTLGYHALLCKLGGGLTRTHNAICTILMQAARAAGFSALKEQVVAELATPKRKEPRVDVDAWGLVSEPRILLDVTVTCPFAQKYEDKSSVESGEQRKDKEYPRKAGLAVSGIAVDVFGRHGPALQELLVKLADLARQHEVDQGVQPRRWLRRWRARISTEIARGCSRQLCTANSAVAPVRQVQPCLAAAAAPPALATTTTTSSARVQPVFHSTVASSSSSSSSRELPGSLFPPACGAVADVQTAAHHTTPTATTSFAEQTA